MNPYAIVSALALLGTVTAGAAVDPNLLGLVMPEAKVVCGIQVQQTLASPFGQFAVSRMPQNEAMRRFQTATGFELQRDLREILMASSSSGGLSDGSDVLVLARGTFAPEKVLAFSTVIGSKVVDYRGVAMISPPQQRDARIFAFLDASTIAVGSDAVIRGLIDRRASSALFSGPLFQKALDASATHDAWFATVTPLPDLIPAGATGGFDPSTLLRAVIESWVGVHFDSNGLTLAAEALTHSASEAQGLAGMIKLVSGMMKGAPAAALQNAQVDAVGPVIRIVLTVPEQDLERSFPGGAARRAAR